jgi:predicted negative regulator of RcsB-dependent stress response
MKARCGRWKRLVAGALIAAVGTVAPAQAEVDFGDHSSATLTAKAWNALNGGFTDDALQFVNKCIELYAAEAVKMQTSLTAAPNFATPEAAGPYWALNDVGTCLFIKGQVLAKKGDKAGAKAAYEKLTRELKYSQCWDPQGWFWKPAEAAKQKLVELEFEQP